MSFASLQQKGSCSWRSSFALPLERDPRRIPIPSQGQCTHHPATPCLGHSSGQDQLLAAAHPGLQRTSQGWKACCPRSPGCHHSYATGCRPLPGWCSSPGEEQRVRQEGERMGSASWGEAAARPVESYSIQKMFGVCKAQGCIEGQYRVMKEDRVRSHYDWAYPSIIDVWQNNHRG